MRKIRRLIRRIILLVLLLAFLAGFAIYQIQNAEFGFARTVSQPQQQLRESYVTAAEKWLGAEEGSKNHLKILEVYNSHEPLAQGYIVQETDSWCAAFVSAVAIECNFTDIIPTECGCQRQIDLWKKINCWTEDDGYVPLPGDLIYYSKSGSDLFQDNTGWADHVGIVVGTKGNWIKTIEGNYGDTVSYRYIHVNSPSIRGYAVPNYQQISQ